MKNKFWTFVNWGILVVVVLVAIWVVWIFPQGDGWRDMDLSNLSVACVDVEELEGFEYEACYDAYSEMIFLKVSRDKSEYRVRGLDVSFVDLASRSYSLDDVPNAGEDVAYKISAQKNPKNIDIKMDVALGFSEFVCRSRGVFVDYCPLGVGGEGMDISISSIGGIEIRDFIEVKDVSGFDSDVLSLDLVEKEAIWESVCKSNWDCDGWEACEEGIQRRTCKDLNNCDIPIDSPVSVRNCDGSCIENWECEWTGCENGLSSPTCRDLNNCGTSFNIPKELSCESTGKCSPDVVCSNWTKCEVDYDFVNLVGADRVVELEGSQTRLCVDKDDCVVTQKEERVCSVSVDIYTERFERCGEDYIGIYSVLDDSVLAVLKEGKGSERYLNIYFDDEDGVYCDYCFDGKMNGDEDDIDCGGSCQECEVVVLDEGNWWDFLFWFAN